MDQVQKLRGWCGLQELKSGKSQTLSLMLSLLLCLTATKCLRCFPCCAIHVL